MTTSSISTEHRQALAEDVIYITQLRLVEHGYTAVSMDELAAQSGISKPTLYSLFASKEELVTAAMLHALEAIGVILEASAIVRSPLERLKLALRWMLQLPPSGETLLTHVWSVQLPPPIRTHSDVYAAFERIDGAVGGLVRDGVKRGEIAADVDIEMIVLLFYTLIGALNIVNQCTFALSGSTTVIEGLVLLFERSVSASRTLATHNVGGIGGERSDQ